jgi:uncharacterized membrane protein YpjA
MGPRPISTSKLLLFGFLTWLIPFVVSVPLVGRDGQPILPIGIFKSLMIVIGSAVGAWLLVRLFRRRPLFRRPGLVVGLLWLGINVLLDLLILVPLTHMSLSDYAGEIALRYLVIPIMAVAIDAANRHSQVNPG